MNRRKLIGALLGLPFAAKLMPAMARREEAAAEMERLIEAMPRAPRIVPQRTYARWRTGGTWLVSLTPKEPYIGPAGEFGT